MTAPKRLYIVVYFAAILSLGGRALAEGNVTVISSTPSASSKQASAPSDGMPVVHKSLHKKKKTAVAATTAPAPTPAAQPAPAPVVVASAPTPTQSAKPAPVVIAPVVVDPPPPAQVNANSGSIRIGTAPQTPAINVVVGPTVETGLPVGRYPGVGTPIKGVSTFAPAPVTVPPVMNHPLFATIPSVVTPLGSAATGMYSNPSHSSAASDDFVFTNFSKKYKNTYPWKDEYHHDRILDRGGCDADQLDDEHGERLGFGLEIEQQRLGFPE